MKVILKQDIKGVGKKDQIVNAADGYARNYLFPKNLAVPADTGNMNNLKAKNESIAFRKDEDLKEAKEISEALKKQYNINVDKKKILLDETIKSVGVTKVNLKLNEGVMATVSVMILTA